MGIVRLAVVAAIALATSALAQEKVDPKAAVPMLLKALAYDTNFDSRGWGQMSVLIVSDADHNDARSAVLDAVKGLDVKVKNRPVRFASAEVKDETTLQGEIDKSKAGVVLIAPGTGPVVVKAVSEVMQDNQIYAVGLDASTVEHFIPLAAEVNGGRLRLVVNDKAATAVGARFESAMLRLARVVQ
jgi:hypothetical protein